MKQMSRMSAALRRPTESGQLWRQVLFFVPVPLPVLGVVALFVGGGFSAPGWTILLAGSVAVASLLLALMVQPTPLPEGLSAEASVRRSLHRFRQITALRVALALSPVAVGAGASIVGGGLFPLFAALALAWPQLLLAAPSFFTITRSRRAMEGWGTPAYLWAALAQPAPVEWPLVTVLSERYRAWRQERTRRAEAAGDAGTRGEAAVPRAGAEPADTDTAVSGAGSASGSPAEGRAPDLSADTGDEPAAEPGRIVPGLSAESAPAGSPTAPRHLPRQQRPGRRKSTPQRPGGTRPKAKN